MKDLQTSWVNKMCCQNCRREFSGDKIKNLLLLTFLSFIKYDECIVKFIKNFKPEVTHISNPLPEKISKFY